MTNWLHSSKVFRVKIIGVVLSQSKALRLFWQNEIMKQKFQNNAKIIDDFTYWWKWYVLSSSRECYQSWMYRIFPYSNCVSLLSVLYHFQLKQVFWEQLNSSLKPSDVHLDVIQTHHIHFKFISIFFIFAWIYMGYLRKKC